ncbi:Glutamine-Leucine-Glutamine, QLQ [Dillenia turbinata]|uniref:Growth-regulating factor n=1 Tax=Dillenia turbinata TaxID=194707 RepID=A0AAN8ZUI3_9MAGN
MLEDVTRFLGVSFLLDQGDMSGGSASGTAETGFRPPFTASQWQELEQQALIYKYLTAGVPVPPELLVPIRKSLESTLATKFLYHPSVNYYSFYGRKIDPEPGRCRRTDGKKWRCSKDAHPDSKYCERHMHRGRNRSRKLVELQTTSHPSSTVTSQIDAGSSSGSQNPCNLRLHSAGNLGLTYLEGSNITQMQMVPDSYGFGNKETRYIKLFN